jgi:hypothetical protein
MANKTQKKQNANFLDSTFQNASFMQNKKVPTVKQLKELNNKIKDLLGVLNQDVTVQHKKIKLQNFINYIKIQPKQAKFNQTFIQNQTQQEPLEKTINNITFAHHKNDKEKKTTYNSKPTDQVNPLFQELQSFFNTYANKSMNLHDEVTLEAMRDSLKRAQKALKTNHQYKITEEDQNILNLSSILSNHSEEEDIQGKLLLNEINKSDTQQVDGQSDFQDAEQIDNIQNKQNERQIDAQQSDNIQNKQNETTIGAQNQVELKGGKQLNVNHLQKQTANLVQENNNEKLSETDVENKIMNAYNANTKSAQNFVDEINKIQGLENIDETICKNAFYAMKSHCNGKNMNTDNFNTLKEDPTKGEIIKALVRMVLRLVTLAPAVGQFCTKEDYFVRGWRSTRENKNDFKKFTDIVNNGSKSCGQVSKR